MYSFEANKEIISNKLYLYSVFMIKKIIVSIMIFDFEATITKSRNYNINNKKNNLLMKCKIQLNF